MKITRIAAMTLVLAVAAAGALPAAPAIGLAGAQFRKDALPEMYRIEFKLAGAPRGLGILFNYHDGKNFAALRFDGRSASLLEAVKGSVRTLPVSLPKGTAGTVFVRPGHVLVEIGGRAAGAAIRVPSGGRYGASPGAGGSLARLVMRREEPVYFTDDFMRAEGTGEHWLPLSGKWAIRYERDTSRSANPFRCIARSEGAGLMATGEAQWREYAMSANVSGRSGTVGLAFAVKDERNFHLFRVGVGSGAAELVRVRDGKETVLAAKDSVLYRDRWYNLSVRADGAGIVGSVDGSPLLKSPVVAAVGKAGLYVTDAEETLFDDVLIASTHLPAREKPPIELFSKVFESDQQMENWASLWSAWRPQLVAGRGTKAKRIYWHKGDFFGDVSIGCKTAGGRPGPWEVGLLVGGDGKDPDKGAVLTVKRGSRSASLTVLLDGKVLRTGEAAAPDDALISLARVGGRLIATVGGKEVLRSAPVNLPGRALALWAEGAGIDLHKVEIRSPNVHDYLFEQAPIEWFARTGTWQITNRWVCDPRWSWLGGMSEQVAQMWTKRAFHGDQTVEFFAAFKMQSGTRYPHVGDINLTICGDGRNLDSGYQVVFAGWGNRWTRLLRNAKVVAGSGDAIIRGDFHRRWFHIKLRKTGSLVQLFIDDELIRQYRDPRPIGGGQIALWTVDNGIMVSRVRIYSERSELRGCLKKGGRPASGPTRKPSQELPDGYLVRDDFKNDTGRWANRDGEQGARLELVPGGGLMLTNVNCGGSFGVTMSDRRIDLLKYPVVRLRYKVVSADRICLNLFATINGRLFEVPLTAPPAPDIAAPLEGAPGVSFHGKADGAVRQVEIDLGARAAKWYEKRYGRPPIGLWASTLYLANASNRKYLMCGFGGNRAGARLYISGFAINAREKN